MADLTITATQVVTVDGETEIGVLGGTVTIGQAVYKNTSNAWVAGQATNALALAGKTGIALTGGASGQQVVVQKSGTINMGAGAAPLSGVTYCLSGAAAGGIAPDADIGSAKYKVVLGVGIGSNKIKLAPLISGVALA